MRQPLARLLAKSAANSACYALPAVANKTHLATAFDVHAIEHLRRRVRFLKGDRSQHQSVAKGVCNRLYLSFSR
ncbi:hypothetical protein FXN63_09045 [Pigmentiphaga aceris]|uniref:Uncharacterized protein n=1 Tax=Pigmentiphaga aceris TaxID=1940612 RepID=A0A5C0AZF8_9BURK|nr:hypothetical protein FXN63_09045 [Pigmentiphaga aceris]